MANSSKRGKTTSRSNDLRSSDPLDQLIHEGGLRITAVEPLHRQGLIVVMLNSGSPIMVHTAHFPRLAKAKAEQLDQWEIIADGTAIGWEPLDEHLSLKGFLLTQVRNEVVGMLQARLAEAGVVRGSSIKDGSKLERKRSIKRKVRSA